MFSECPCNSEHATTENSNVSVAAKSNVKVKKSKEKDILADKELLTILKKVNQNINL